MRYLIHWLVMKLIIIRMSCRPLRRIGRSRIILVGDAFAALVVEHDDGIEVRVQQKRIHRQKHILGLIDLERIIMSGALRIDDSVGDRRNR